jgi:hypothetical protein
MQKVKYNIGVNKVKSWTLCRYNLNYTDLFEFINSFSVVDPRGQILYG